MRADPLDPADSGVRHAAALLRDDNLPKISSVANKCSRLLGIQVFCGDRERMRARRTRDLEHKAGCASTMGLGSIVCVKTVNIGPLGFKGYPFFDQRRLGNQSGDRSCEVYVAKQDGRSSVPEHDAQFLGRTMLEAAAVSHPASKLHNRRSAASVEPKNGTACSLRRAAKPKSLCAHACTKVKGQSMVDRPSSQLPSTHHRPVPPHSRRRMFGDLSYSAGS